jgi:hypothetical protein
VPRAALAASLAAADVHLASLSSGWEGVCVPSKIAAVFAVGRPVVFVGTRRSEAAEWITTSGGGWVVEEGDVDGLVAAIREALDPAQRARRGEAAAAYARRYFDRERNCTRIAELIERSAAVSAMTPAQPAGGEDAPRPRAATADASTATAGICRSKSTKQWNDRPRSAMVSH